MTTVIRRGKNNKQSKSAISVEIADLLFIDGSGNSYCRAVDGVLFLPPIWQSGLDISHFPLAGLVYSSSLCKTMWDYVGLCGTAANLNNKPNKRGNGATTYR